MTLRLSVVSEHGIRLGAASTKVFGVHGGSIGRGTDNAWILPDPERYLSGKHARIDFRAGTYVLIDTSSNGTFVNGAQVPLGKYHDYTLKHGDYVRLGEYEFLVSIEPGNDFPPDQSAIVAYDGQSPSSAVRKSTADDLGADLDLSELLEPSDPAQSGVRPRNAYGQAVMPATAEPLAPAAAADEDSATPWHMMTRPLKMEPKPVTTGAPGSGPRPGIPATTPAGRERPAPVSDGELEPGFAALCRGAGIDPRALSAEARGPALQLAGQMLRETVLGLMDLTQSRNELRSRFHITPAAEAGAESPLDLAHGVDDTLLRLLCNVSTRAGSVDAVRDHFKEFKAQNTATMTAMRVAFDAFMARIDPKELEQRFDRAGKRNVFGAPNKGKYWDLYTEMFPGLAARPADGFPHFFSEAFSKAYEAKLRTLIPPRRSAFGGDREESPAPADRAVGER